MSAEVAFVGVFCGSSDGAAPVYRECGRALGRALAAEGVGVVYGGASIGIMGAVADGCLEAGGEVIGILPGVLLELEIAHPGLDVRITDGLHARKAAMYEQADGFLVLPGGAGTLDELFEIVTWAQIGLHSKPVVLWNVEGFFDALLAHVDHAVSEGFIPPDLRDELRVVDSPRPEEAIAALSSSPITERATGSDIRCALSDAGRAGARAAGEGFDWHSLPEVWTKVTEELEELRLAVREMETSGNQDAVRDELGDLLFAAVALARWLGVDPAEALRGATTKFNRRLATTRQLAGDDGFAGASLDHLVALWQEAKHLVRDAT